MKTKLFITLVAVISAVTVTSVVAGSASDISVVEDSFSIARIEIYDDWDDVMC